MKSLQQMTQADPNEMCSAGNGLGNRPEPDEMELMDARNIKSLPKAILCSIHQPSSETFQRFSHIILMHAGRTVFQGTRDEAITYFSRY